MASHFKQTGADREPEATRGVGADGHSDAVDDARGPRRLARHERAPEHGTSPAVTGAFQRLDPAVTGSFAALSADDLQPLAVPAIPADDAPRPIGVDPAVTGSFARIEPMQAARAVTRDTAAAAADAARARTQAAPAGRRMAPGARVAVASRQPVVRHDRRPLALIAAALVLVLAAGGLLAYRLLASVTAAREGAGETDVTQVAADESLTYLGSRYALVAEPDGTFALTAQAEGAAEPTTVCIINGTPAQLMAHDGSIIVPESHADGTWDVIAYTPGGDALATQVLMPDGSPAHGSGEVTEARIEGDELVIADSTGATTSIPLA